MGCQGNKVFLPLSGKSVLAHTAAAFAACPAVKELLVVAAAGEEEAMVKLLTACRLTVPWQVITGGSERQYSIANALANVSAQSELILVHDGARPLVRPETIQQVMEAARQYGAAIVAVPVKDTIKTADAAGRVTGTPDRSMLWAVQTPQGFRADLLQAAYREAAACSFLGTDDASLVEHLGQTVHIVSGCYDNIKITTPEDIVLAEALLAGRLKKEEAEA